MNSLEQTIDNHTDVLSQTPGLVYVRTEFKSKLSDKDCEQIKGVLADPRDYYSVLQIDEATLKDLDKKNDEKGIKKLVNKAYRKHSLKWHEDKIGHLSDSERKEFEVLFGTTDLKGPFNQIFVLGNEAKDVFLDQDLRSRYILFGYEGLENNRVITPEEKRKKQSMNNMGKAMSDIESVDDLVSEEELNRPRRRRWGGRERKGATTRTYKEKPKPKPSKSYKPKPTPKKSEPVAQKPSNGVPKPSNGTPKPTPDVPKRQPVQYANGRIVQIQEKGDEILVTYKQTIDEVVHGGIVKINLPELGIKDEIRAKVPPGLWTYQQLTGKRPANFPATNGRDRTIRLDLVLDMGKDKHGRDEFEFDKDYNVTTYTYVSRLEARNGSEEFARIHGGTPTEVPVLYDELKKKIEVHIRPRTKSGQYIEGPVGLPIFDPKDEDHKKPTKRTHYKAIVIVEK